MSQFQKAIQQHGSSSRDHPLKRTYFSQSHRVLPRKQTHEEMNCSIKNSFEVSAEMQSIVIVNEIDIKSLKEDNALSIEERRFKVLSLNLYERKATEELYDELSPLSSTLCPRNVLGVPTNKTTATAKLNMIHPFGNNLKSPRNQKNLQTSPTIPPIISPRNNAILSPPRNGAQFTPRNDALFSPKSNAAFSPRSDALLSPRNKNIAKPYLAETIRKKPKLVVNRAQTLNIVELQKKALASEKKKILLPKLTLTPQRQSTKEQERKNDYLLQDEMKERYILTRRGWDYHKTIQSLGSLEQESRIAKEKKFGTIHGTDFSFSLLNEAFGDEGEENSMALLDEIGDYCGKEKEEELFDLSVSTIKGEYLNQSTTTATTKRAQNKEGVAALQKNKLIVKKKKEIKMLGIKYFDTERLNIKNYRKVSPREMSCKSVRGKRPAILGGGFINEKPEEKILSCRNSSRKRV